MYTSHFALRRLEDKLLTGYVKDQPNTDAIKTNDINESSEPRRTRALDASRYQMNVAKVTTNNGQEHEILIGGGTGNTNDSRFHASYHIINFYVTVTLFTSFTFKNNNYFAHETGNQWDLIGFNSVFFSNFDYFMSEIADVILSFHL
ncbi:hypothetical protein DGG96_03605 [Legionella qingyii]|uniref:Uncharacterized protein n=2 Tax=Legionella qingyii TaxID=2184757 RepID=A0A317U517_9GAMM|nr:hypothetical protein DGG96_03605 [Legionella qingyii]